jgi:hypothetical protein
MPDAVAKVMSVLPIDAIPFAEIHVGEPHG